MSNTSIRYVSDGQIIHPLCYLATPYSKYQDGNLELAYRHAAALAARLMLAGVKVYSPIAHTHPLAVWGSIDPLDHNIWLPFDEAMMDKSDVLIVAHMDGWEESRGIKHEIEFFERANKPIFDLNIETLTMSKRKHDSLVTVTTSTASTKVA